tara:strand:- start:142 stop:894 length:753 start_codon:yes stop_codon:yes gene_type:complete
MFKNRKNTSTFILLLISILSFSTNASFLDLAKEARLDNEEAIKSYKELYKEIDDLKSEIPANTFASNCDDIKSPFQKSVRKNCKRINFETKVNELRIKRLESLLLSNRADLIVENIKFKIALKSIESLLGARKIFTCSLDSELGIRDHFVNKINFQIQGFGSNEKQAHEDMKKNKYYSNSLKNPFCSYDIYTKLSKIKCHVLSEGKSIYSGEGTNPAAAIKKAIDNCKMSNSNEAPSFCKDGLTSCKKLE